MWYLARREGKLQFSEDSGREEPSIGYRVFLEPDSLSPDLLHFGPRESGSSGSFEKLQVSTNGVLRFLPSDSACRIC